MHETFRETYVQYLVVPIKENTRSPEYKLHIKYKRLAICVFFMPSQDLISSRYKWERIWSLNEV